MLRGEDRDERRVGQQGHVELAIVLSPQGADGDVDITATQQREDLCRGALAQLELDARMLAVKGDEHLGQPRGISHRRGDARHAATHARMAIHRGARLGRPQQQCLGVGEELLARGGQRHGLPWGAVQERQP